MKVGFIGGGNMASAMTPVNDPKKELQMTFGIGPHGEKCGTFDQPVWSPGDVMRTVAVVADPDLYSWQ